MPYNNMHVAHTQTIIDMETGEVLFDRSYEYRGEWALCDRAAQKEAKQAAGTDATVAGNQGAAASQINSVLTPQLEKQATNPTGYNPTDLNSMLVASQQGAGGANSGITGQANLTAARTRNAGGFTNALDEAARVKNRQLSQNALGIQNQNANVKLDQQQSAQKALQGLYGTDTSAQLSAMGLVPGAVNSEVNAGNSGWLQNTEGIMNSLGNLGKGVGDAATGLK
jgi:hypothetical protein